MKKDDSEMDVRSTQEHSCRGELKETLATVALGLRRPAARPPAKQRKWNRAKQALLEKYLALFGLDYSILAYVLEVPLKEARMRTKKHIKK